MASRKLLLLPGDGIGPETMAEVEKLVTVLNETVSAGFTTETALVGGSAPAVTDTFVIFPYASGEITAMRWRGAKVAAASENPKA